MSWKHLGEVFDIHGGGIDLVFPHHENEIAQSTCAFGHKVMANVFMHNGFLQVEGQKMSKSLGNFITIHQLLETDVFGGRKWSGEVLRLAMLKTHYRQPIDFTVRALDEAEKTLLAWADIVARHNITHIVGAPEPALLEALADDLNTAAAFAVLADMARKARSNFHDAQQLVYCAAFLGFDTQAWLTATKHATTTSDIDPAFKHEIEQRINARIAARNAKNWAESDRLRDELVAMGIELQDGKDEAGNLVTRWAVKK
jgi:cysteinyl-tRNA synthetase